MKIKDFRVLTQHYLCLELKRSKKPSKSPLLIVFWLFDNFCQKIKISIQCGFNPLFTNQLRQWIKTTLDENAKIVKKPVFFTDYNSQIICLLNFKNLVNMKPFFSSPSFFDRLHSKRPMKLNGKIPNDHNYKHCHEHIINASFKKML